MTRHLSLLAAALLAIFNAPLTRADPLHALDAGAYWHHDSNFIFPATVAEFTRVGAPQELDGSSTVVAYYARGAGESRLLASVEVFPVADGPSAAAAADAPEAAYVRSLEHAGWRIVVRTKLPGAGTPSALDSFVHALRIDRLGTIDTRCPNAGCGT